MCKHHCRRGLQIDPPPRDSGPEPLFRVVYQIDVNEMNPLKAAQDAYETMIAPWASRPILTVIDHHGHCTDIDLSEQGDPAATEGP